MLESIEIFIDLSSHHLKAHDLIEKLACHNYDSVEFTVHVENSSLRLRLFNSNQTSVYDGALAVENYSKSISRLLVKYGLKFSIIETLNSQHASMCEDSSLEPSN